MNKKMYKQIYRQLRVAKNEFDRCIDGERARRACKFIGMFEIAETAVVGKLHDQLFADYYKTYAICERYHDKLRVIGESPV